VPYDELLRLVWGEFSLVGRENLKVHVHSLKKKLQGGPSIDAVRGFGYRMKETLQE
jgi:DNA-binding response OmpR family regulator